MSFGMHRNSIEQLEDRERADKERDPAIVRKQLAIAFEFIQHVAVYSGNCESDFFTLNNECDVVLEKIRALEVVK